MSRYLEVQAQGVLEWLCRPPDFAAQKIFVGLLRMPHSVPLVPATLAAQFGLELREFSRALFELSRRSSLQVINQPRDHSAQSRFDFDLLREDLLALAPDTSKLMVATVDGLCLAQHGLEEEVCIRQAALCHQGPNPQFPCVIPLHLGARVVRLCSTGKINTSSEAFLRLARRLISLPTA